MSSTARQRRSAWRTTQPTRCPGSSSPQLAQHGLAFSFTVVTSVAACVPVCYALAFAGCGRMNRPADRDSTPVSPSEAAKSGSASTTGQPKADDSDVRSCLATVARVSKAVLYATRSSCAAHDGNEVPAAARQNLAEGLRKCIRMPRSISDRCSNEAELVLDTEPCGLVSLFLTCTNAWTQFDDCLVRLGDTTFGPCSEFCTSFGTSVRLPPCCWRDPCETGDTVCCPGGLPGRWNQNLVRCDCSETP